MVESATKISSLQCSQCTASCTETDVFCPQCGVIQPPSQANHFARFGADAAFEVDVAALESAYFTLQKQLHPDKFVRASDNERTLSLQQTVSINEAYDTLKTPLKRAEYLLALQGITVNAEQNSVKAAPAVLMETMEQREVLAEATTKAGIRKLAKQFNANKAAIITLLAAAFLDEVFDEAAQLAIRLRYIEKALEEVKLKKQQLRENHATT